MTLLLLTLPLLHHGGRKSSSMVVPSLKNIFGFHDTDLTTSNTNDIPTISKAMTRCLQAVKITFNYLCKNNGVDMKFLVMICEDGSVYGIARGWCYHQKLLLFCLSSETGFRFNFILKLLWMLCPCVLNGSVINITWMNTKWLIYYPKLSWLDVELEEVLWSNTSPKDGSVCLHRCRLAFQCMWRTK